MKMHRKFLNEVADAFEQIYGKKSTIRAATNLKVKALPVVQEAEEEGDSTFIT